MRTTLIAVVVGASFAVLLVAGMKVLAEDPEQTAPGATAKPSPPPPPAKASAEEVRQWLRQLNPSQRRLLLRELVSALRQDLTERHREAAQRRFRQADANQDGVLSFEEAWKAGLFRMEPRRPQRPPGPVGGRGLRERLERRAGERGPFGRQPRRRTPGAPESAAQPPMNDFEEELMDTWELLQELNVLERGAGEE